MRHTLSVRIPFAEHNAGKRIGWNCQGQAWGNQVSECPPHDGNFFGNQRAEYQAVPASGRQGGITGCADGDEDARIWDLVRFLVTTE